MIIKDFEINFKEIIKKKFFLLYGENLSLISEIEKKIVEENCNQLGFVTKKYYEEYLLQKPDIFYIIVTA